MSGIFTSKFGDWEKAGVVLQRLNTKLMPALEVQLMEDGQMILTKLRDHIQKQDLSWTPLSPTTIRLKGGSETIYVETGFLRDNISVRKIKSAKNDTTIFIGASPWKKTPDGVKFSDLMIWLEYGTDKMPPRPLIRPTWEEVEPIIKANWQALLANFLEGGDYF